MQGSDDTCGLSFPFTEQRVHFGNERAHELRSLAAAMPILPQAELPDAGNATRLCMAASTALKDKKAKDAAEGAAGEGTPKKE